LRRPGMASPALASRRLRARVSTPSVASNDIAEGVVCVSCARRCMVYCDREVSRHQKKSQCRGCVSSDLRTRATTTRSRVVSPPEFRRTRPRWTRRLTREVTTTVDGRISTVCCSAPVHSSGLASSPGRMSNPCCTT
jgi:hypothetical protein